MIDSAIDAVVKKLRSCINTVDSSPFSYERYLLIDRGTFLEAFIKGVPFPPFEVEIQMSSRCNLKCQWCIGDEVQAQKQVLNLPNTINKRNIDTIIDGIMHFQQGDLGIEAVKFSGFIGEPLVQKAATLRAIQRLSGAGLQVGLFTNGVFLTEETWKTLSNIEYVHVSLDAGPSSFYWLKEHARGRFYTEATFSKVLKNIEGLHRTSLERGKKGGVRLNVGYVIVPGNHEEIYTTTKLVRDVGADMIRFKCDIVGKHSLAQAGVLDTVFRQIGDAQRDFHDPPNFSVYSIHSRHDIEDQTYAEWKCDAGCYYQHFLATVGSDGNLYLCDHNTMPGGIPLGNVIDRRFEDVWNSKRRKYLTDGVEYTCQCAVCPPFGNRANIFLKHITGLCEEHGRETVSQAAAILRAELTNTEHRVNMGYASRHVERKDALLITGASGFIGGNLAERASGNWRVFATYHRSEVALRGAQELLPMDVADSEAVRSVIHKVGPATVVHCAAITNMDNCADHVDLAVSVNVEGTQNVAVASEEIGARVVYVSTDLVFDGGSSFYSEQEKPNPICVYGKTKFAGEDVVSTLNTDFCIVRAAWTFGMSVNASQCSAERMIAKLHDGTPVALFTDEYRNPVYVTNLCDAILELAARRDTGIYHLGGPERVSRYEFGLRAADAFGFDKALVSSTTVDAFGFRDRRPLDCSLSSNKAAKTLLTEFLSIKAGLREMAELFRTGNSCVDGPRSKHLPTKGLSGRS